MAAKKSHILVCGSVVVDIISKKKFYGGTAANIAYGLGQLKALPLLFSLVGNDFKKEFRPHLKKMGITLRVSIDTHNKTANFSYSVNKHGVGNGIWSPNAYKNIDTLALAKTITTDEIKDTTLAIFSPGNPKSTCLHLKEFRTTNKHATVVFDPGQMITSYSKKQFIACMTLSDILILNELEYTQLGKMLGKDPVLFFNNANKIIIKTEGAKGSTVFKNKKVIKIPATHPKKVVDTTGAGDAYRAGLLSALWKGKSITESCLLGAKIASKNVECMGCQKYKLGNNLKNNKK